MVKSLSILFLSIYLFTFVQVNELFKIPILIEHFNEHQAEHSELSLIQFIVNHYMDEIVYDDDYSKDMELPFKSTTINTTFSIVCCPIIHDFNFTVELLPIEFKSPKFTYLFSFSSYFQSAIWQPPQFS